MCGCLSRTPHWGTWPTTQACALTGNRTGDPLVQRSVFNPLSHSSQGKIYVLCICTTEKGEIHQRYLLEKKTKLSICTWPVCSPHSCENGLLCPGICLRLALQTVGSWRVGWGL